MPMCQLCMFIFCPLLKRTYFLIQVKLYWNFWKSLRLYGMMSGIFLPIYLQKGLFLNAPMEAINPARTKLAKCMPFPGWSF